MRIRGRIEGVRPRHLRRLRETWDATRPALAAAARSSRFVVAGGRGEQRRYVDSKPKSIIDRRISKSIAERCYGDRASSASNSGRSLSDSREGRVDRRENRALYGNWI